MALLGHKAGAKGTPEDGIAGAQGWGEGYPRGWHCRGTRLGRRVPQRMTLPGHKAGAKGTPEDDIAGAQGWGEGYPRG